MRVMAGRATKLFLCDRIGDPLEGMVPPPHPGGHMSLAQNGLVTAETKLIHRSRELSDIIGGMGIVAYRAQASLNGAVNKLIIDKPR